MFETLDFSILFYLSKKNLKKNNHPGSDKAIGKPYNSTHELFSTGSWLRNFRHKDLDLYSGTGSISDRIESGNV